MAPIAYHTDIFYDFLVKVPDAGSCSTHTTFVREHNWAGIHPRDEHESEQVNKNVGWRTLDLSNLSGKARSKQSMYFFMGGLEIYSPC